MIASLESRPHLPAPPSPSLARPTSDARARAHAPVPERVDVAIVGSGLGGLVAAAYLAQAGLRVAVFESHYTAGGCATEFVRGPKSARYRFDVGLHYVGDCREDGTIPRILADVGTHVAFSELAPEGFDRLVFPDFDFAIPRDLDVYRDRLVAMFPHERRGIDRYVKLVQAIMRLTRTLDLYEGRRPPLLELARIAAHGLRVAPHMQAAIGPLLSSLWKDPRLSAVVLGQSGDYGLPPSRASAMLHLGLVGHYFRGAYYPKGGGQVLADRLAARVEELGGSIHLRTPVERILVRGGRASGVRLAAKAGDHAREVSASLVLSNADLKRTLLELVGPEHLPQEWITKSERFEMAAGLFMTFLGLSGDGRDLGLTSANVWQFDGYDMESFYRGGGPRGFGGCYVTSATMKDPEHADHHAPPGHTNVEVMSIVPQGTRLWPSGGADGSWAYKHDPQYEARKQSLEEELIERLDHLFPGAAQRVVFRESATPLSHARFTGASEGSPYGLAATPEQFMKKRPGYRGPIPGLFLAGASTRAGHGIVGAMMGGRAAARRVLQEVHAETRVKR